MKKCPTCGESYEKDITLCPSDGTALLKMGDALVGQTLAGKYRIEERIGEGGMSAVYRAIHVLVGKKFAVKVLHPSLAADEKIVARFTREARTASLVSHRNAVDVTDFGEDGNGVVFMVMQYVDGPTLKQMIRQDGPLPLALAVDITRQIAGALDAAHANGVIHRDLKSENVMLEHERSSDDWVKVMDFGIAKIQLPDTEDPELTAPNLIIGTPQYMSPEQCSKASGIDYRSDIYSLGVIVYEMLAGRVPFTGESATAIMVKHLQQPPPSVLESRPDLPPAAAQVVARALSKQPEGRQQRAGELAEELALAAGGSAAAENSPGDSIRIAAPLSSFEGREGAVEDDEMTVVRPSGGHSPVDAVNFRTSPAAAAPTTPPPPAVGFNPWKIMIPAALLLVALMGVFFAMQRDPAPADSNDGAPLAADPNARPVEPLAPPTGAGESGVSSGSAVVPAGTPAARESATPIGDASSVGLPSVEASPAELPVGNSNDMANDNSAANANSAGGPSPTPAAGNDNRGTSPTPRASPTPSTGGEDPPPPKPTPRTLPTPSRRASPPVPQVSPPTGAETVPDN